MIMKLNLQLLPLHIFLPACSLIADFPDRRVNHMKKINLALLLQFSMMVNANAASCPTDFDYVHQIPWDASSCSPYWGSHHQRQCCQTLLSLFSIGLAQHLNDFSMFQFPDYASATACLNDFQQQLSSMPTPVLSPTLLHSCLDDTFIFVSSPSLCEDIQTKQDWIDLLGTTAIDLACKGDLSDLAACNFCLSAAKQVNSRLVGMNQNHTAHISPRFFNFMVLYVSVVNEYEPESPKTAYCTFKFALSPPKAKDSSLLVLISTCAVTVAFVSVFIINCVLRSRRNPGIMNRLFIRRDRQLSRATVRLNTDTVWFSTDEIKAATHNFSQANLIGQGAFGTVYKGRLPDGQLIAVKRIRNCSAPEGVVDFFNEVEILNKISHPNLVALRGCCVAREDMVGRRWFLIYDYMPNGNVDEHIFGENSREPLIWSQRKNIVLGIAKGLAYLHSGVQPAIYHRNIKPTNILLDAEMNARVSDFGLARIMNQEGGESQPISDCYLAPEHVLYGQLTEKSDVYSFGVVLLEIMSGRKFLGTSLESASDYLLMDWAWTLVKANKAIEVVDGRIRDSGPVSIMMRFVAVGLLCAHVMEAYRPTIVEALKMLEGDIEIPEIPDRPLPLAQQSLNRGENSCGFLNISTSATSSPISPTQMLR